MHYRLAMAERKRLSTSVSITHARLYRDDLEKIERILVDLGNDADNFELNVIGPHFKASSVAELAEAEGETILSEIEIRSWPRYVTVRGFANVPISVSAQDAGNLAVRGALDSIAAVLNAARVPAVARLGMRVLALLALLGGAFGLGVGFAASITAERGSDAMNGAMWLVGIGLVSAISGQVLMRYPKSRMVLRMQYRQESPGFWARNQDQTIVATISAVGGAIIGALLTKAL